MRVTLAPAVERTLRASAVAALPREACALLGGVVRRDGVEVLEAVICRNRAADGRHDFSIDPEEVWGALRRFRAAGLEPVGSFHSHPGGATEPSDRDRRELAALGLPVLVVATPVPGGAVTVHVHVIP